jgi:hypothetical protein
VDGTETDGSGKANRLAILFPINATTRRNTADFSIGAILVSLMTIDIEAV